MISACRSSGMIEGSGGGGSVKTIETKGAANLPGGIGGTRWYWYTTANMARVPVVGLGLGSVAGLGAARLAASHYSVMTKNSAMFVAGPPVVKRLGQDLTKQELGGADIQTRAGGVDHAVDTEEEAFACARRFLSYLPSSVYELPPTLACDDDPERSEESLMKAVPRNRRQVYKMRPIINAVVDKGSFFEMAREFRPSDHRRTGPAAKAAPCCCSPAIPFTMAGRGPRKPARRWCAGSISPRPSICRWSI